MNTNININIQSFRGYFDASIIDGRRLSSILFRIGFSRPLHRITLVINYAFLKYKNIAYQGLRTFLDSAQNGYVRYHFERSREIVGRLVTVSKKI